MKQNRKQRKLMAVNNFSLSKSNLPYLIAILQALDLSLGYVVSAKIRTTSRSIEQNSRLWKLYNALGMYIGEHQDKVHDLMGWKFLRYQDEIGGESVELIKSTTKLSTKEMGDYQDQIEQWGSQIGFYFDDNKTY